MAAHALSGHWANRGGGIARATRHGWSRLLHRLDVSGPGLTKPHHSALILAEHRARTMTSASSSSALKGPSPATASPPFHRPSSPYPDPRQLGPRSQILATRTSNYHSTSLRNSTSLILISPLLLARANPSAVVTVDPSVNRTSAYTSVCLCRPDTF